MNNITYNLNSLSKEELSTILEALIFGSSVDICANWYKENVTSMLNVSEKIRKTFPEVLVENIYVVENTDFKNERLDENTKDILNLFPEIRKEQI